MYGSRQSSAAASALIAPTYAISVWASAAATAAIIWLNVSLSPSTSRLEPVTSSWRLKSCARAMVVSCCESVSIGWAMLRATQRLAAALRTSAPMPRNTSVMADVPPIPPARVSSGTAVTYRMGPR